ncbi:DNA mismatch repair protein MutS [Nitrospira sp. Nam80]
MGEADLSPLMRQYRDIKQGCADAILFFRVGDFYEMFYEDAVEASALLSIALTSRDKNSEQPVPLCGVPYHAATGYIAKLLKAGRTVALCEQVENPAAAKGLVRREVVRLYTPGTLVDGEFLLPSQANFLAAVATHPSPNERPGVCVIGLAVIEVSTGSFYAEEFFGKQAIAGCTDELARIEPKELLFSDAAPPDAKQWLNGLKGPRLNERPASWFRFHEARRFLLEHFKLHSLDGFGCASLSLGIEAAAAVLRYLYESQPSSTFDHITCLKVRRAQDAMALDAATIHNLELVRTIHNTEPAARHRDRTLLSVLDHTVTAMGTRLLREWVLRPLLNCASIQLRLDAVAELKEHHASRAALRSCLRTVQDISRLSSRISLGVATPRDLVALCQSVSVLSEIVGCLDGLAASLLKDIRSSWDFATDIYDLIERALLSEAPISSRDGNLFKDGYHPGVDEFRKAGREGRGWIASLEAQERQRTGIDSLKVRYNNVFGYYIEITKPHLSKVPADFIRKQTLANAERFTTAQLKELEERVIGAEAKLKALEHELFESLRRRLACESARLQKIAERLALLDVLAALSEAAALNRYVRPIVDESGSIAIAEGRHPVVEQLDGFDGFVPNDTRLNLQDHRLVILTGPNMAGKSTYLRQVALITLLAQIGSFVPAKEARIGLVDRIFTRVGASDNLAAGQSTFMVEMTETAQILNCATRNSLILLDEIGRGTSTYDGLSIAWAVAEYIQDTQRLGARTLFATHYHEMTQLETLREGIRNYRVAVQERDGEVLFLRKIVAGGADRSYGIHVAKLAGLPPAVILRAQQVLVQLEQPTTIPIREPAQQHFSFDPSAPRSHPLLEEVRQLDIFSLTPLDALNKLADIRRRLEIDEEESSSG